MNTHVFLVVFFSAFASVGAVSALAVCLFPSYFAMVVLLDAITAFTSIGIYALSRFWFGGSLTPEANEDDLRRNAQ